MIFAMLQSVAAWDSFVKLFAEMSPLVYVLFIVGIIFCVIETFVPGFGFFGISGIVMIVLAIVLRMLAGGDVWMLLFMLIIAAVLLTLCFVVLSRAVRKGKLGKTALFDVGTSVPTGATSGTTDFSSLVGKTAVTCNFLRPVGKVKFEDGQIVDVVAKNGFIEENVAVTVVATEGQKVVVEQVQ